MFLIKIEQQDLLRDGKNSSDSIAYFTRVYNNLFDILHISTKKFYKIKKTYKTYTA